jgi:colanic acid/amylovoran biosynthesis glycosyltransferase
MGTSGSGGVKAGSKIGYLIPEFPSQTHVFFWREIAAFRQMGVQVVLLSTRRPPPGACKHEFAAEAARETHYVFPPRPSASASALLRHPTRTLRALRYIAQLNETPWRRKIRAPALLLAAADLAAFAQQQGLEHIHVHSCADAAHVAALCHLLGGPPYSLTLHGDLPVYGTDHRRKAAGAVFVSCVTRPLQQQLREQVGLAPERAPVIWMGVDTNRFRDTGQRRPQPGKLHLLTVSRLNRAKGHQYALAAMRTARDKGLDIHYTIAGEGPDRPHVEAEIARLGLQGHVTLTGTVAEAAVLALLQKCDAFILSSIGQGEAAPVAVMEAMSCAMPVICSIIGGTADMIQHGVDGFLVNQQDEAGIAEHIIALASDLQLRNRIGSAARARAVNDFDAAKSARKLHDHILQAS